MIDCAQAVDQKDRERVQHNGNGLMRQCDVDLNVEEHNADSQQTLQENQSEQNRGRAIRLARELESAYRYINEDRHPERREREPAMDEHHGRGRGDQVQGPGLKRGQESAGDELTEHQRPGIRDVACFESRSESAVCDLDQDKSKRRERQFGRQRPFGPACRKPETMTERDPQAQTEQGKRDEQM